MKTVKDLILELMDYDMDRIVILSKDAEGNSFSPMADISDENYKADSTYSGELQSGGDRALVLWPVN